MPRRNWLAECLRLDRLLIAMQNQRVIKYCSLSPLNLCTIDFNPSNFLRLVSEPHSKWHFKMAYINSDTNPAKKKSLNEIHTLLFQLRHQETLTSLLEQ